jgi:hypothetical protein
MPASSLAIALRRALKRVADPEKAALSTLVLTPTSAMFASGMGHASSRPPARETP